MSELNEVVHEEQPNTPQVTCPIHYQSSIENLLGPICVQVCGWVCLCARVTDVSECVFVTGRRQDQAVGQGTVGSITHGLKIKKLFEVFTGPRMIVNPAALAPGQNTLHLPSPILSTGGQAWLPPSLSPRGPGARTAKGADTRVVQREETWSLVVCWALWSPCLDHSLGLGTPLGKITVESKDSRVCSS